MILIANEDLRFSPVTKETGTSNGLLTREEIIRLAGSEDCSDGVVIQWLPDGSLKTLGVGENARLVGGLSQWFIVFSGSIVYEFELNGHRFPWGASRISGAALKKLLGLESNRYEVWHEGVPVKGLRMDDAMYANLQLDTVQVFSTSMRTTS